LPPKLGVGSISENVLLEQSAAEIKKLQLELGEAAFDGGFSIKATAATMAELSGEIFIAGSNKNAGVESNRWSHQDVVPQGPGREEGAGRSGRPRRLCLRY
jgi:hypothetical protein